ncbi:hypothetical protein EV641_104114 [Rhodococcus sp. SMB37]|uniref:hypothetical protein n=1 Tax=Rhodococcus sp. SMB37 TaxID=2512213 RepID=UPI0010471F34|nr:hypothetical protein [Rhodococcus sp. SMB37]TCN54850.1 hypothetical protein EV641_104114 [Rhodococcus sp. SMB37]
MLRDTAGRLRTVIRAPRGAARLEHRLLAAAVTALGGVAIAVNVPDISGFSGRLWVVSFVVAAPLIAIARLLPGINAVLALIVGAAGALVINVLVVQTMLSVDAWSPHAGVAAVGFVAALVWLVPNDRTSLPHTKGQVP